MRARLLPKGYERLDFDLDDLTRMYRRGSCDAEILHGLIAKGNTWMYDPHLNMLAQLIPSNIETPDGSFVFAVYFTTSDQDTIAVAFPKRDSHMHVLPYVRLRPRVENADDAVLETYREIALRSCKQQMKSISRLLEGTIRDYHDD